MNKFFTTLSILLIVTTSFAHSEAAPEGGTTTIERVIDVDAIL